MERQAEEQAQYATKALEATEAAHQRLIDDNAKIESELELKCQLLEKVVATPLYVVDISSAHRGLSIDTAQIGPVVKLQSLLLGKVLAIPSSVVDVF